MEFKGTNKASKIIKTFNEAEANDTVNWKHENGSTYIVGGILSKLNNQGEQFFAIGGKWVKA